MKTQEITHPVQYKNCIITPVKKVGGFDVIDSTGRWFHVDSQKQAKWWSSVYSRIENEFALRAPKAVVPTPVADHTPKPKKPKAKKPNIVSTKTGASK
jgi:hypothetical protein